MKESRRFSSLLTRATRRACKSFFSKTQKHTQHCLMAEWSLLTRLQRRRERRSARRCFADLGSSARCHAGALGRVSNFSSLFLRGVHCIAGRSVAPVRRVPENAMCIFHPCSFVVISVPERDVLLCVRALSVSSLTMLCSRWCWNKKPSDVLNWKA